MRIHVKDYLRNIFFLFCGSGKAVIEIIYLDMKDAFRYTILTMKLNIKKLEAERKRAGLTKAGFSKRFGLTQSTYGKMLLSKSTTVKTMNKIASVLKIDAKDLLT